MNADSSQLLRMLEPAVRPGGASSTAASPQPPLESQSFDALLTLARDGAVRSGRNVSVGFERAAEMDRAQIERLSLAADRAEAAGAQRAVVLMDGAAFMLDVAGRVLTEDISTAESLTVTEVDHAVVLPGTGDGEQRQVPAPGAV